MLVQLHGLQQLLHLAQLGLDGVLQLVQRAPQPPHLDVLQAQLHQPRIVGLRLRSAQP